MNNKNNKNGNKGMKISETMKYQKSALICLLEMIMLTHRVKVQKAKIDRNKQMQSQMKQETF